MKGTVWLDDPNEVAGFEAVQESLSRLSESARILYVGLQPGDEPMALLAYLSQRRYANVASAFITRNERGANQVGLERGDALAVLRSAEALTAAKIVKSDVFFLGFPDVGECKNATDALMQWNEKRAIAELVTLMRDYRPHVVLTHFTGRSAEANGQQRALGVLVERAYERCGFSSFPTTGQALWRPDALFLVGERMPGKRQYSIDVAKQAPSGKSFAQLAVMARASYRSLELPRLRGGLKSVSLSLLQNQLGDDPAEGSDPFDKFLRGPETLTSANVAASGRWADKIRINASAARDMKGAPDRLLLHLVPGLAAARYAAQASEQLDAGLAAGYEDSARNFTRALHQATGLQVDLRCDRDLALPGETVNFTLHLFAPSAPVIKPRVRLTLLQQKAGKLVPLHYELVPENQEVTEVLKRRQSAKFRVEVQIPDDATSTTVFDVKRGWRLPFGRRHRALGEMPVAYATVTYQAGFDIGSYATAVSGAENAPVSVAVEARQLRKGADGAGVRTQLRVLSPVDVSLARDVVPAFLGPEGATCYITAALAAATDVPGVLTLEDVPPSWTITPSRVPLELKKGEARTVRFTLTLPHRHADAAKSAKVKALFRAGRHRISSAVREIDPRHVGRFTYADEALCLLSPVATKRPTAQRIACVPGPDLNLIAAFETLVPDMTILQDSDLAARRFHGFDTIILAPGAYDYRNELVDAREGLLTYALDGGRLVVMHQDAAFATQNCAPFRLHYSSPSHAVTDERARVKVLAPLHPLLTQPNELSRLDFDHWQVERGRFFLATDRLPSTARKLLLVQDPGDADQDGGLVYLKIERGEWIYCALNLQEQLSHHVPGAWRLLANLLGPSRAERLAGADHKPEPGVAESAKPPVKAPPTVSEAASDLARHVERATTPEPVKSVKPAIAVEVPKPAQVPVPVVERPRVTLVEPVVQVQSELAVSQPAVEAVAPVMAEPVEAVVRTPPPTKAAIPESRPSAGVLALLRAREAQRNAAKPLPPEVAARFQNTGATPAAPVAVAPPVTARPAAEPVAEPPAEPVALAKEPEPSPTISARIGIAPVSLSRSTPVSSADAPREVNSAFRRALFPNRGREELARVVAPEPPIARSPKPEPPPVVVVKAEPPAVVVEREPTPAVVVEAEPPAVVVEREPPPAVVVKAEPPPVVVEREPPPVVVPTPPAVVAKPEPPPVVAKRQPPRVTAPAEVAPVVVKPVLPVEPVELAMIRPPSGKPSKAVPPVAPTQPKPDVTEPKPSKPALPDTEWPEALDLPPAPTQITADAVEYDMENGTAIFIGNVQVIDDRISLKADRLRAKNNPQTNEFQRITAEGNVTIVSEDRVATGDKAIYDLDAGTIVLSGKPMMREGPHEIVPEEAIVYDRRRGVFSTRGRTKIRLRSSGGLDGLR